MRGKPCVDAVGVETMLTVGERADFITVGELRQAHGAVLERAVDGGGEEKSGKGLDDGRIETGLGGGSGRKGMGQEIAAATAAEADVGVEENDEDYEKEEENGSAHHNLAVMCVLGFNVWHHSHD